jgi:hypothetical protein
MRGVDGSTWPAGVPRPPQSLRGDRIGGRGCQSAYYTIFTLGGLLSVGCRDREDLARLTSGWNALAMDFESASNVSGVAFNTDKAEYDGWAEKMGGGEDFTADADEIAQFDNWAAKLESWRNWFQKQTGTNPSGPSALPPPEPPGGGGSSTPGGIASIFDKATGLLIVAGVVFVGVQLLKR